MLTVVILTKDEERHIARAISSVRDLASQILIMDSGSTDETVQIAQSLGAVVQSNPWTNYARQFNHALDLLPDGTGWVMRLDADEVVSPSLAREIAEQLPRLADDIEGVTIGRRMSFMGRPIRHGGVFPIRVLRIFRHGAGRCEDRWMDEHIKVSGPVARLKGEILDDNLNSLSWWTAKHNSYASREVVDLLNLKHGFMTHDSVAGLAGGQAGLKRWLKERLYVRLPSGLRAFAYFFWRYVLRLGFLDGREGLAFHVLQGFWYRFLVDAKLAEATAYMIRKKVDAPTAIRDVLGIDVMK